MHALRPYQQAAVETAVASDERRVCIVAPTGAGKTRIGLGILDRLALVSAPLSLRALWVVHTTDLAEQARRVLPNGIEVATIQARGWRETKPADVLILDECHHYVAEEWSELPAAYPDARIFGLTATPQRRDGVALSGLFGELIVAAHYPDLISDGHLVPCRVLAPPARLDDGIALRPVDAYLQHGEGRRGFCYVRTISEAHATAEAFRAAGIPAAAIEAGTLLDERTRLVRALGTGEIRILTNVYTLTEGVDVPSASICILARNVGSVSGYLQMAGRVLRPAPDKTEALLLDLPGLSHAFGGPCERREYSLDGEGISANKPPAISQCMKCGAAYETGPRFCPTCGFVRQPDDKPIKIYNQELAEVYAGAYTPAHAQQRELERLLSVAGTKNLPIAWVAREYRQLFGASPNLGIVSDSARRDELERLQKLAQSKGYRPGWAAFRYKALFGTWPRLS